MQGIIMSGLLMVLTVLGGAFPSSPEAVKAHLPEADSFGEIAGALPETTLFYASIDLTREKVQALYDSSFAQLTRDEQVQAFLDDGMEKFKIPIQQISRELQTELGFNPMALASVFQGRINLAVTEFGPPKKSEFSPTIRLIVTIDAGEKGKELIKAVGLIFRKLMPNAQRGVELFKGTKLYKLDDGNVIQISYALYKKTLVFTFGSESIRSFLTALENGADKPLNQSKPFLRAKNHTSMNDALVSAYLNLPALLPSIENNRPPQVRQRIEAVGVHSISYGAYQLGVKGGSFVESLFIGTDTPDAGVFSLLPKEPVAMASLRYAPVDSLYYTASNLAPETTYHSFLELMKQVQDSDYKQMLRAIKAFEQQIDMNVRQDLLAPLGNEMALYVAPPSGWKVVPEVVAILEVDDLKKAKMSLQALIEIAEENSMTFEVKTMAYDGHKIVYLKNAKGRNTMPFTPAYMFHDNHLLVSLLPQTLKEVIDRLDAGAPTLATSKTFQTAIGKVSKKPVAIEYIDTQAVVGALYNAILPIAQRLNGERENPFDMALLPTESHITRYIEPYAATTTKLADGLVVELTGPVPITPLILILLAALEG